MQGRIIARLQQPYALDYISVEAEFQVRLLRKLYPLGHGEVSLYVIHLLDSAGPMLKHGFSYLYHLAPNNGFVAKIELVLQFVF